MNAVRDLPQVAEVMPVKLEMTSCQAATDVITMHGVDKDKFQVFHEFKIDRAALESFRQTREGGLAGERIAKRYGWQPGQDVVLKELKGISFHLCGTFTATGVGDDTVIVVGRRFLQEAVQEEGISNQVLVKLKPGADASEVSKAIDQMPFTIHTSTRAEEIYLSESLDQLADLVSVSKVVLFVVAGVILLALGNAIAMATRERTGEFAVLRTLGFQKGMILMMVMMEGLFQALMGGLLGCLIVHVLVAGGLVKTVATCGITINLVVGAWAWGVALGAVVLAGLLGCLGPAWFSSRIEIVTALRKED
jgi:putative ABC transport system permease protein